MSAPTSPIVDQPPPVPNERPAVWPLVIADMEDRHRVGVARYGVPLQAFNGRDPLVDAYQEALDLAVYLRQAIEERTEDRRASIPDDLKALLHAAAKAHAPFMAGALSEEAAAAAYQAVFKVSCRLYRWVAANLPEAAPGGER